MLSSLMRAVGFASKLAPRITRGIGQASAITRNIGQGARTVRDIGQAVNSVTGINCKIMPYITKLWK